MRRGKVLSAAIAVPLALITVPKVFADPTDGSVQLREEPMLLAQVRRPGQPVTPPPPPTVTEPAAPAASQPTGEPAVKSGASTEPRVVPTMPSELMLRPAQLPRTPTSPGYAGFNTPNPVAGGEFLPIPDRWRVGQPRGSAPEATNTEGSFANPYRQNVLKGDYALPGTQDMFLVLGLTSDTLLEARRLPIPSGVSTNSPNRLQFFGEGDSQLINQNFIVSAELFRGNASYQPKDFAVRATVVANLNYVHFEEHNVVRPDPRDGQDRTDGYVAFQELFVEKKLFDLSKNYDFVSVRAGVQGFSSDFRGFLFADNEPGVRLFGNYDNNRTQYNLAFFNQVEKDTNSGLNEFNFRNQQIFIANVYRQDFLFPGYTAQLSFHYNHDHSGLQYDENGFLARPAPVGTVNGSTKDIKAYYVGWAGDGHIGRFNITHQYYYAFGTEDFNPIAGQGQEISAHFAALELSYDFDYVRVRASFQYQSGDNDPTDGRANGFDSIFDNPNFAGGGTSFYTRQALRLTGTNIGLMQRNSPLNNLRTSKEQGQANFVNPGLFLYNIGVDVDVTPQLKLITNASYLRFEDTSTMRLLLQEDKIGRDIGIDLSAAIEYRPLLNQNVVISAGFAVLIPGEGFKDIYTSETLYSGFVAVTLTY